MVTAVLLVVDLQVLYSYLSVPRYYSRSSTIQVLLLVVDLVLLVVVILILVLLVAGVHSKGTTAVQLYQVYRLPRKGISFLLVDAISISGTGTTAKW
jgi:hypothetical protein